MRGVILAAGDGGRFRPYTYRTPKVLIQLRERPLISYPMAAMAKAGISEVGVVVGYQAGRIVEELTEWAPDGMRLEFIYNHEFDGGNAVSVRAARKFTGDSPFMLAMGDHVIEPGVAACLMRAPAHPVVLGIDSAASMESQLSDATKVLVNDKGHLLSIGKDLRRWNAVDIGVFVFQPSVFDVLDDLYTMRGVDFELNHAMQHLADQPAGVATCDVEGLFWSDIDTVEDYKSTDDHLKLATNHPL